MDEALSGYGLSPPTRGNLENEDSDDEVTGSIPAHAGEPWG